MSPLLLGPENIVGWPGASVKAQARLLGAARLGAEMLMSRSCRAVHTSTHKLRPNLCSTMDPGVAVCATTGWISQAVAWGSNGLVCGAMAMHAGGW